VSGSDDFPLTDAERDFLGRLVVTGVLRPKDKAALQALRAALATNRTNREK
jgi:hypothetical protein